MRLPWFFPPFSCRRSIQRRPSVARSSTFKESAAREPSSALHRCCISGGVGGHSLSSPGNDSSPKKRQNPCPDKGFESIRPRPATDGKVEAGGIERASCFSQSQAAAMNDIDQVTPPKVPEADFEESASQTETTFEALLRIFQSNGLIVFLDPSWQRDAEIGGPEKQIFALRREQARVWMAFKFHSQTRRFLHECELTPVIRYGSRRNSTYAFNCRPNGGSGQPRSSR